MLNIKPKSAVLTRDTGIIFYIYKNIFFFIKWLFILDIITKMDPYVVIKMYLIFFFFFFNYLNIKYLYF